LNNPSAWWQDDRSLRRFASHLLAAELTALRPGSPPDLPAAPWTDDLRLDEQGLGVDSLDRMQLAAALAEALNLDLSRREAARLAHIGFGDWLAVCRQGLAGRDTLSFRSSGSTGLARPWRHSLAGLEEEATFLAALFPHRQRVLATVPAHHVYGFLFTVLLPRALGDLPVEDLATPAELPALWHPGDLVVGFPDLWRAAVRQGRGAPSGVLGTTSTAPCPAELALGVAGLGIGLTEIFGSSETAGLGWRRDPDAPFRWFPWWQPQGEDDAVRRLPDGETVLAPLPDRLEPAGAGLFRPAGRRDTQVQVGGINVSPAQVRACLLEHPWVQDAAVRPMRPDEGSRLKAFIVPHPDAPPPEDWREALVRWIDARLPPPERPRALRFGPELPVSAMGKAADWDAQATALPGAGPCASLDR
jgi:4-coumarate--CoA ligase (photoactive yellow protein activation family)